MKKEKDFHQGKWWYEKRNYFIILNLLALVFLWNGEVLAAQVCKTASVTASTPTTNFIINGNGTVTDKKTHLMWKRCSEGQTWNGTTCIGNSPNSTLFGLWGRDVLRKARGVKTAGFTDWRVPNRKELLSIVEVQCHGPSINATIFPATPGGKYFTSSPYASSVIGARTSEVWKVGFSSGGIVGEAKIVLTRLRLVRGGL